MNSIGNLRRNGKAATTLALTFALLLLAFESAHLAASSPAPQAHAPSSQSAGAQGAAAAATSAAAKVQAAIDARCDGIHPGAVLLPPGILQLDATLHIPSECSVAGGTSETTLRATENFAPRAPNALVSIAGKKDATLQNLTLDGNRPANKNNFDLLRIDNSTGIAVQHVHGQTSANGIAILNASSDVKIENSEVERCGLPLPSADGGGVGISPGASAISRVQITNSRIHDNNQCIALFNSAEPGKNVTEVTFAHNSVYSNANDGINVTSSGHPSGGSIIGLRVVDNETYCNGWTEKPKGGPGGLGFSRSCKPGFFQRGADSSSGVGIDIIGNLTVRSTVASNRTHDNLFDGISNDASLMVNVSTDGNTVHRLSGPPFNPKWQPNQPVIIKGKYYHIVAVSPDGSALTVSSAIGANEKALLYGPSVVNNSFAHNISSNNATGIFNQMADGDEYTGNQAIQNALAGFYTNGGSQNTYQDDVASENGQNHTRANQGFAINEGVNNRFYRIQSRDRGARPTQEYGLAVSAGARNTVIESSRLSGAGRGKPVNNLAPSTVYRQEDGSLPRPQ